MIVPTTRLAALGTLLALAAGGLSCEMPPDSRPERVVTLLYTGGIRGNLGECQCPHSPLGRLDLLASMIERERAEAEIPVVIDAGDIAGAAGDRWYDEDVTVDEETARRVRASIAYEALGTIGYDLYVPGERDLSLGMEPLLETVRANGGNLLADNLWWADQPHRVGRGVAWVNTDAGRVAIIGVTAPLTADQSDAAARGHDSGVTVVEAVPSLALLMPDVVDEASFVVLVAHGPIEWVRDILHQIDGFDLAIVSHDGAPPEEWEQVGNTMVVPTDHEGRRLCKATITLNADGVVFGGSWFNVGGEAGTATPEPDPDVSDIIDTLNPRLLAAREAFEAASPGTPHPTGGTYRGFPTCTECHAEEVDVWYLTGHVSAFQALQRTGWHTTPECFECHSTGFGYDTGFTTRQATPFLAGVTCEACHGPSGNDVHDEPGFGSADASTCAGCHRPDRSPDFNFNTAYPQIQH